MWRGSAEGAENEMPKSSREVWAGGDLGSVVNSHSRVRDGDPAENDFSIYCIIWLPVNA